MSFGFNSALKLADRGYVLETGKVILEGTAANLLKNKEVQHAYLGKDKKKIISPGVAGECQQKCGMHLFEDAFIPEIIDPETCQPLPPGSVGELVLTTLTKEAFPLIRYRTRDITSLDYTPCACGRT